MSPLKGFFILFFINTFFFKSDKNPFIVVLGITQDAGYPQIGCDKECCKKYWDKKIAKQKDWGKKLEEPLLYGAALFSDERFA